jgi:hypothetical protein
MEKKEGQQESSQVQACLVIERTYVISRMKQ